MLTEHHKRLLSEIYDFFVKNGDYPPWKTFRNEHSPEDLDVLDSLEQRFAYVQRLDGKYIFNTAYFLASDFGSLERHLALDVAKKIKPLYAKYGDTKSIFLPTVLECAQMPEPQARRALRYLHDLGFLAFYVDHLWEVVRLQERIRKLHSIKDLLPPDATIKWEEDIGTRKRPAHQSPLPIQAPQRSSGLTVAAKRWLLNKSPLPLVSIFFFAAVGAYLISVKGWTLSSFKTPVGDIVPPAAKTEPSGKRNPATGERLKVELRPEHSHLVVDVYNIGDLKWFSKEARLRCNRKLIGRVNHATGFEIAAEPGDPRYDIVFGFQDPKGDGYIDWRTCKGTLAVEIVTTRDNVFKATLSY
jgi:hypothetical protein